MNYSERFEDIATLQLNVDGFSNLTEKQKKLCYYLSEAGLWGRYINIDQASEKNIPLLTSLISIYEKTDLPSILKQQLHDSLFILFSHNGIYHNSSGEKLTLPLTIQSLDDYKNDEQLVANIKSILLDSTIPSFRTVQTEDSDVVSESGGNFYKNLTTEEVNTFRKENYPTCSNDQVPPFGFNERLVKLDDGTIERQTISVNGLYGKYIEHIIQNLTYALNYTENEKQYQSISTLIDFYKSGAAEDFDKHCIAWVQDTESDVFFINGLIESYEDPLGVGCTFESIVAVKNFEQTAKVNKIIENVQWFEDNLPFDKKYKKDKAVGLSASSISVISMAGEAGPSLPLGVNLPNSEWIRQEYGSKSVNLDNVSSARSAYETALREELYLEKYHSVMEKYFHKIENLHTDLHEITGHGSGKVLEGVSAESLGAYFSTIEEARADLVGLYFMPDEKLKEFGIYDEDTNVYEATLSQYVGYITIGAFAQLRKVTLGNDLTQAHYRNRQLISNWILQNSDPEKIRLIVRDNRHYVEVNDIYHVKEKFGQLLEIVQTIKSTGDFEGAKQLVMNYGTKVDLSLHQEIISRVEKLNMPKVIGFITPMLVEHDNSIIIEQSNNFIEHQLQLHKKYFIENKPELHNKRSILK